MKETVENNKIIAEFMGAIQAYKPYVNVELYEYDMFGIIDQIEDGENEQHYFLPEQMLFHSDWNWLMEVVEKIESLGYDSEIIYRLDDGGHCCYLNDSPVFSSQMGSKIEAVYNACLEFIKWYNEQKSA